ncbi:MAG: MurR/RpiR family transcriptional regulator [Oscillospiraceae bacterium]
MQRDANAIRMTSESVDRGQMARAVEAILAARHIYIVGVRSSAALANYLNFYFRNIFDNVRLVSSTATSEMFEQLLRVGKDDVVIAISLPRYSSRTVKLPRFCRNSGAKVVAITDSDRSPGGKNADFLLTAKIDMVSLVDSLVAPLSLVNALIVAIGLQARRRAWRRPSPRIWSVSGTNTTRLNGSNKIVVVGGGGAPGCLPPERRRRPSRM